MKNQILVLTLLLSTSTSAFAADEKISVSVSCKVSEINAGVESIIDTRTQTIETAELTETMQMGFVGSEPLTVQVSTYMTGFNDPITSKVDQTCLGGKCVEGESDLFYKLGEYAQDEIKVSCYRN